MDHHTLDARSAILTLKRLRDSLNRYEHDHPEPEAVVSADYADQFNAAVLALTDELGTGFAMAVQIRPRLIVPARGQDTGPVVTLSHVLGRVLGTLDRLASTDSDRR